MKKRTMIFVLLLTGAVLAFAQNSQAYIREITGTVELKLPNAANWTPAKVGDRIGESTIVSTGFKSAAILAVGNSTLTVRALTRLSLESLLQQNETETVNIGLSTGRIRADVKPPTGAEGKTNFSVRTPTATASVRGTVFDMDTVTIKVLEGSVSYEPSGDLALRPIVVNSGQESWVDADTGTAINPFAAADSNLALPSLPGQSAAAVVDTAKPEPQSGSLVITIELEPQRREER